MKKKCLLFLVLLFSFIGFSASHPIQAEAKTEVMYVAVSEEKGFPVVNKEPTEDKDEIYNRYEENSFSLMNKEFSSLNKINEFRQNLDSMIKNWVWSAASAIGRFNARMVKGLFSLDLATQVKEPFQELSLDLANSLVTVATTFGLVMVALFMVIKYATTGQFFEAVKIFGLAILTMISFAIFTDPKGNEFFFDGVISIDHQLEKALAGVNPNFKPEGQTHFVPGNGEEDDNDLANRLAAEVFYNNVYVPYLYMQYGTADEAEIREQAIEYNGQSFDRIGALLDNDSASEAQVAFVEDVTDYEVDELGNTNPIYTNAFRWTGLAFLYVITNGLQFFIYGLLGIVRIAFQFLLVAILVFFPIALIFAMVIQGKDVLGSYFKGLGTIMFIKGGISLLMVIFMSYVTLAYSVMNTQTTDPLDRVITFIAWILAPPFLWTFRRFLGIIFTPGPYASKLSRMGMALRHPIQANRQAKAEQAAQKAARQQQREDAKARYKKKQAAAEKNGASSHGLNEVNKKNKPENALRAERNKAAEANKKAESTDKDKQDLRAQRAARKEVDPKASEQPGSDDNELNKTNGQSGPVSDRRQNRQQSTDSPQKSTPTPDEASSQDLNKPRQGQEESEKRTKRKEQSTGSGEVQGREKQSERSSSKEAAVGSKVAKTGKQTPAQQRQERSEPTQSTSDVGAKTKSVGTSTRQVDRKTGEPTSNQGSNSKHTKGQTVRNPAQAPKKERGKSAKKQATSNEQKHAGADKYLKKDNQTVRQPVRRK
ncbi:hypothetical protein [Enterococcus sp. AZ058]|uniref:hypothetical protein n=1 Tax=unclassified Enterococcus TaxID=2608891 RepID=UPI003D2BEBA7